MSRSVTVRINGQEREGIEEGWIAQTINDFRRAGQPVCVRVSIDSPGAKLGLLMGDCSAGGGGVGQRWSAAEAQLIDAWRDCVGVDKGAVEPGLAIRCIKRIERLVD